MSENNLTITSYKDAARKDKLGTYDCFVSPESITMHQNNDFGILQTVNNNVPLTAFSSGAKSTMEIDLVLDGTGAYAQQKDEPIDIATQLKSLIKNTTKYEGSIHQPPFLEVVWGSMGVFSCRAESLKVKYKTFNSKGKLVAAQVNLILIEDAELELSKRQANQQSPDLFHHHTVADYETLALISYQYYNSTNYMALIADSNELDNLYDCVSGTTLLIPPLALQEDE